MKLRTFQGKFHWTLALVWVLGAIVVLFLLLELLIAPLVRKKMLSDLSKLPDHRGETSDVDLRLWKNEATFQNFTIFQKTGPKELKVFFCPSLGIHLAGSALLKGALQVVTRNMIVGSFASVLDKSVSPK